MTSLDDRWGQGTTTRLEEISSLCLRAGLLGSRGREWYDGDPELGVPHRRPTPSS